MSVTSFSYLVLIANVTISISVTQLPCASAATHRGVFVTPVTPDSQSAALGCGAVMSLHFCGLFSMLNSWFVAGKLRHGAAGACSLYLWWGVGAVTEGQEGWGCSRAVVTTEQCLVLFHPFSGL